MTFTARKLLYAGTAVLLPMLGTGDVSAQGTTADLSYTRLISNDSAYLGRASLSPDGRWLAYSQLDSPNESSLWIAPAGGGAPQRLATRGQFDDSPVWAGNDRLLFTSNLPARGDPQSYGMVLSIDPGTGRATGPARQVTLDPVASHLRPSPDGRSILYVMRDKDGFSMKVVPVQGGSARVVTQTQAIIGSPTWSADSRSIYYVQRLPGSTQRAVLQIPAEGGRAKELFRTADWVRAISLHGHVVTTPFGSTPTYMSLLDRTGRALTTTPLQRNTRPSDFTSDGRSLLMVHDQTVAPMRVVPLQGGAVRTVSDANDYHWPIGFTPDGAAVLSEASTADPQAIVISPIAGGAARRLPIPGGRIQGHAYASGHYAYVRRQPSGDLYSLFALDLQSGRETLISDRVLHGQPFSARGPGGEGRLGGEFLFLERRGAQAELRAAAPGAAPRLVRTVPENSVGRTAYAVHGERVAWWEVRGDSTHLMIAEGAAAPRSLLAAPGQLTGAPEVVWSWSGTRIAAYWPPDANRNSARLMVADVPRGATRATPRLIESGALYFYFPKWLPDDSGIVTVAGYGMGVQSHILHIPLAEGAQPVIVTRDDPSLKWGFELSPDGRLVSYPGEIPRGSAILRADLGALLRTASASTW